MVGSPRRFPDLHLDARILAPVRPMERREDLRRGIKPFGFMLVAYADPTKAVDDVGRLVHPYERDPKQWLKTEWADSYEPDRRFKIAVRRSGQVIDRPGVVYVRTYRDVLLSYLGHPEAKSLGSDGQRCRRSTRGLLHPCTHRGWASTTTTS